VGGLARAFFAALAGLDLARRVFEALPPLPPVRARVRVVAIGKAAPAMALGALRRWPDRLERVLVIAPDGTACDAIAGDARVEILRAPHPLPDARSVVAADRALSFARGGPRDLLVALVSGGASSLACAPASGLSLETKRSCVAALLASGARIDEVNTVRRHLSRIKGGGLTRAASPGRVLALIVSDVLQGAAWDIGSGPTVVDPTTVDDARETVARYAPDLGDLPFVESLKASEPAARRQRARIIASPDDLALGVAEALRKEGYTPRMLQPSTADVGTLAAEYEKLAAGLAVGEALLRPAEPSLAVPRGATGRGGRSGHLAALASRGLPAGVELLAGASDGVDGSSGAAGALVDSGLGAHVAGGWARVAEALAAFDSAAVHDEAGTALRSGPTGVNVADVHVLARRPPGS